MKPLALSVGDPAGVGPEVAVCAAAARSDGGTVLFGDAHRLELLAVEGGWPRARLQVLAPDESYDHLRAGQLGLVHVGEIGEREVRARRPTVQGGSLQLAGLEAAMRATTEGRTRALVTGPVSKEAIGLVHAGFVGHTEFLAQAAGLDPDAVTMMFLGPRLRVALATTHVALGRVASALTVAKVRRTVVHLAEALTALRRNSKQVVRIAVSGLNPHAGESGIFGSEEQDIILPGLEQARSHAWCISAEVRIAGPLPAEAALRRAAAGSFDGVVAMYHDQATIASKLLDWGEAVNVTWGLPFVRTSVDHGVAYDAAGTGQARADGMLAALRLAERLAGNDQGAA